jgi:hypothetical protein
VIKPLSFEDRFANELALAYLKNPHAFARLYLVVILASLSADELDRFQSEITNLHVARATGDARGIDIAAETLLDIAKGHAPNIPLEAVDASLLGGIG